MEHGERAYQAIKEMAKKKGISLDDECENLGTSRQAVRHWPQRKNGVASYYLLQMYLAGYDIIWIMTGEKKNV